MITVLRKVGKIIGGVMLVGIFCFGVLYTNNIIGTPIALLEKDIRSSQKIAEDWLVLGTTSDEMAAFISYPADKSDHVFSIYVNRPGFSLGYFFRSGGSVGGVQTGIAEHTIDGYSEHTFISLNEPKVARLEIDDGTSVQVIAIDSSKPFAIIVPLNAGTVTFYDVDGQTVAYRSYLS